MELSHQHSLLEEVIMAPTIDTSFPNEFFHNAWNFTPFDQTPDLHLPLTNPSLFELISPAEFQDYPFLDSLSSSEFGFFLDRNELTPMAIHQDCAANFENGITSFKAERAQTDDPPNVESMNAGVYCERKSKSKKSDGQPSKNLMAERRRRKRLNDRLSMLRSIVPKISKMDRTSILGDAIDYMRELVDKIQKLREEGPDECTGQINLIGNYIRSQDTQLRKPPKFDVERRNKETRVEICCAGKAGLLLSTLGTLDALGLEFQQCVISCFNDFSFQASCCEAPEQRSAVSTEDVKQALFRNAGYGGRCL